MGLVINHEKVNEQNAKELVKICPFSAISYNDGKLDINAACKLCKICVKKGPAGVIEFKEEEKKAEINKDEWRGITVFADHDDEKIHNVTLELIGKAKELAKVINHPVQAVLMGYNTEKFAETLISYGVDKVYVYDHENLKNFDLEIYANLFEDYINRVKPSSILVGATNLGRSLAPRVAARFRTGLTADCTVLEMKENTDLVQIRPAFGGNIMAQIVNPNNRPQFCTVRYKIFSAPEKAQNPTGEIVKFEVKNEFLVTSTVIKSVIEKPIESDISDSDVIVAVGRGLKPADIEAAKELAALLGGNIACTRPLVENGSFDAKHQIGLSGKTVKPKIIITLGISGAVQFAAGMKSSDIIIAVNTDRHAPIFDIAHYCVVGDASKIIPSLVTKIKEARKDV